MEGDFESSEGVVDSAMENKNSQENVLLGKKTPPGHSSRRLGIPLKLTELKLSEGAVEELRKPDQLPGK